MTTFASAMSVYPSADRRPWGRAALWLMLLGPLFFASYGFCNQYAARLGFVPSYYGEWERAIPFLPWLMLPYWSIDGFYAASLFVARDRAELDALGRRLLLATFISCIGFLLFPLRFAFERPEVAGFNGWLLARLTEFDAPFNQAPSLHVSLLVILLAHYRAHLRGAWKWLLSAWFALIGVSVLGTYQHHVIDVAAGAIAGVLCLYLVPVPGEASTRHNFDAACRDLALRYGAGAVAAGLAWAGMVHVGLPWLGLLFAWAALALALVALGYARVGSGVFQKRGGRIAWPARLVLAPYLLGARVSAHCHNRGKPALRQAGENLYLGRLPRRADAPALRQAGITGVLDLTAEFSRAQATTGLRYLNLPVLDLTAPTPAQLRTAADFINTERAAGGRVLVHCALGLSRSACAVLAAEVRGGLALEQATGRLQTVQPRVVLRAAHLAALRRVAE